MKKLHATKPLRLVTFTVRALQSVDLTTVAAGVDPVSARNAGCGVTTKCTTTTKQ